MARTRGTNHIIQRVTCHSEEGSRQLVEKFGGRSRGTTVEIIDIVVRKLKDNEWLVRIEFDHTCLNSGNAAHDSRRFVRNAMKSGGKTYGYETHPPEVKARTLTAA